MWQYCHENTGDNFIWMQNIDVKIMNSFFCIIHKFYQDESTYDSHIHAYWERERERVCVCVWERESVCVCVCVRERERERVCVCVCVYIIIMLLFMHLCCTFHGAIPEIWTCIRIAECISYKMAMADPSLIFHHSFKLHCSHSIRTVTLDSLSALCFCLS
jgi:hypothetical protein